MPRTHHAHNNYRLSCNCIISYTSVHQTGEVPKAEILCPNCRKPSYILVRYPSDTCEFLCRTDKPGGGVIRVLCSLKPGHGNKHYDETVDIYYDEPGKLKRGKWGNT
jgi:hypothetical protein